MDENSLEVSENSNSQQLEESSSPMHMDDNTNNTFDYDSGSKQSDVKSEPTNIDALDDTARDTLFVVPPATDDSSQSNKSLNHHHKDHQNSANMLSEALDFEGDDDDGEVHDPKDTSADSELLGHGQLLEEEEEEEGECEVQKEEQEEGEEVEEGEELEEGEVSDDDPVSKDPKPICRFFGKGQCTWGSNCRFLHPGVVDKGLYNLFDPMRPLLPLANHAPPPLKPGLLGIAPGIVNFPPLLSLKPEEPAIESAWERGLRHAKEIIKQSVKRKETDIDFEEKKMNLSLAQEEIDKENDYYVKRHDSPPPQPVREVFHVEDEEFEDNFDPNRDWTALPHHRHAKTEPEFVHDRGVHKLNKPDRIRQAPPRDTPHQLFREAPPLHEPEVRMVRESALRRAGRVFPPEEEPPYRDRIPRTRKYDENPRNPEEWHDPWSRTKSPAAGGRKSRKDSKKSSYSSGSSKSSSRSSSKSSKSSKSSRSSRSSIGSKTLLKKRQRAGVASPPVEVVRKIAPPRLSPKPMRIAPPAPPKEEFSRRVNERIDRPSGGGPSHYQDRPPERRMHRLAPPPPEEPNKTFSRDSRDQRNSNTNRGGGSGGRRNVESRSWQRKSGRKSGSSSRSRSRSRSNSRSRPFRRWSKSRSRSKSRSSNKVAVSSSSKPRPRSKFSRDKSLSKSRSASYSRSRSVSSKSSSSSRSSSSSSGGSFPKAHGKRKRTAKHKSEVEKPSASKADSTPPRPSKQIKLEQPTPTHTKPQPPPKSQVKLTLKPTGFKANKNVIDRLADGSELEQAEQPVQADENSKSKEDISKISNLIAEEEAGGDNSKGSKLRREELLKQLKAVEEAIAKKRNKLT